MPKKAAEPGAPSEPLGETRARAVGALPAQFRINSDGARSRVLRAMTAGKRHGMGLGGFPDVTLAEAKQRAREARALIHAGSDLIQARVDARSAIAAATAKAKTFDRCSAA